DNVNQLAANLTTQVRAIADVATAVTKGDLTREIKVAARGEVAVLKDTTNEMIRNLRETTSKNSEQDWLKTNLAKFSRMLQGQKDLLLAGYALDDDAKVERAFTLGSGLVGQCARERRKIVLANVPAKYMKIRSGLGKAIPLTIIVLPVIFEGEVRGVIELASFERFSDTHQAFLDQLTETIGIVINTIEANTRTEDLLEQSQSLAGELQSQQDELKKTNEQLELQAQSLR